jgi:hypothetical protein
MGVRFGETGEDQLTVGHIFHEETGNGFLMVGHVFHGPAEQPMEPTEPVSDTQLVPASDPVSEFPTLGNDPISQFETLTADVTQVGDLFCGDDGASGVVSHGNRLQCENGIFESFNRLNLRSSDAGYSPSAVPANDDKAGNSVFNAAQEVSPNFDHADTLHAVNQSLQVAAPKFMWETGFLGAVFNSGTSVVDTLFNPVSLKRPATAFVDLLDDKLDEVPIAKALRKGAVKPIYLDSFSRASSENESSKRKSFLSGWVTLILVNCSAFSAFDEALSESTEPDRDSVFEVRERVPCCKGH